MIGGGRGAFIGGVHRMAAQIDSLIELKAGAFSSNVETSRLSGDDLGLDPKRVYSTYIEMLTAEAALPADERIDFVSIVTPNHMHYPAIKAALQAGFPVICDKPLCLNLVEAEELKVLLASTKLPFALTHNYTGYPMVREARNLISEGKIGKVRRINVEYLQGWLSEPIEQSGQKQADWRTDPARSGAAGCMGDIGTHAANLAEFITNDEITSILAQVNIFVEGRRLDDDVSALIKTAKGAQGTLQASQIANGEENALTIRIYGAKGGLSWAQQEPNTLILMDQNGRQIIRTGKGSLGAITSASTRIPAGHPEGYLEAFATIYKEFAEQLRDMTDSDVNIIPGIEEGIRGMRIIAATLASSQTQTWTNV